MMNNSLTYNTILTYRRNMCKSFYLIFPKRRMYIGV